MKRIIYFFYFFILFSGDTGKSEKFNLFSNSLAGEYKFNIKKIVRCVPPPENEDFVFNYYVFKKSANETEIRGNSMGQIPFDDSFDMNVNLAMKNSNGTWIDTNYVYKSKNACSKRKFLFGDAFIPFMNGLGFPNPTCPQPAGNYTATGADVSLLQKYLNKPKTFIYGLYSYRLKFLKNGEVRSCIIAVIDVKRPWELD